MQDAFPIPSCFGSGGGTGNTFPDTDPVSVLAAASASSSSSSGAQSVVASVYCAKIAGRVRLISVSWCRSLLAGRCLCVSVEGSGNADPPSAGCRVELRPWCFWRKAGSKQFFIPEAVRLFWDLRAAKFNGDPEPRSNFYVALVHAGEAVLLLGDLAPEAPGRTGPRPPPAEPALVSKKEHIFGKKRFATRSRFGDKGKAHHIVIECGIAGGGRSDPEMVVRIDGDVAVHVKHLQWKFRGNETVAVGNAAGKCRVELYWDVHGWLFGPGPRHALFIFKPLPTPRSAQLTPPPCHGSAASESCLFLYAWKLE